MVSTSSETSTVTLAGVISKLWRTEAIAWALAQPPEIDVGEIIVRSAAQP